MKRDLYQEVTDRILEALENGNLPMIRKPWKATGCGLPVNATTKRPYRGVNVLLLALAAAEAGYPTDQWLTFKQAAAAGVPVKKGEKATRIYFFKRLEIDEKDQAAGEEQQAADKKVIPLLREYYVFNVAQLSGVLPGAEPVVAAPFAGVDAIDAFVAATGAEIRFGGDVAGYAPSVDRILMPVREAFNTPADFYAVELHELTHWTGNEKRLNRLAKMARFGDESYAAEELVAEMGAAFLCAKFGVEYRLQHAAYIKNWIKVLKNDKRAIFTASSQAQKAVDFLEQLAAPAAQAIAA